MKKIVFAIPLLALAACEGSIANAVGGSNGSMSDGERITTSDTNPGNFEGISLAGPDNVVFTTSDNYSIRAEGDADVVERLRYELQDGNLKIGREKKTGWSGGYSSATVYVSAPSLKKAKLAGSGNLRADKLSGSEVAVSVAGSGNVNVDAVEADDLTARISGSGDMNLAGQAKNVSANVTGSGVMKGKALKTNDAVLKVTGSGDLTLTADGTVDAKVTGSGDIRVHGKAKCTTKTTGSGEITCGQ
ncbi:head GIN domain-containing protein [Parasphingorhabdus halotolerans]|uniref:DUF2807 domain-containing protein n=1 Tax=Parasphingorhabdus halotolerans TaxID=2725558 RepID=A0A6H2DPE6_9SPHN|nr:head GIN domain-containing protein [Parasphingorhabdus halotolerans]QJB70068.1 DUF2807 domain-containing protein [Parasphingorhabdus halotolerans]